MRRLRRTELRQVFQEDGLNSQEACRFVVARKGENIDGHSIEELLDPQKHPKITTVLKLENVRASDADEIIYNSRLLCGLCFIVCHGPICSDKSEHFVVNLDNPEHVAYFKSRLEEWGKGK